MTDEAQVCGGVSVVNNEHTRRACSGETMECASHALGNRKSNNVMQEVKTEKQEVDQGQTHSNQYDQNSIKVKD